MWKIPASKGEPVCCRSFHARLVPGRGDLALLWTSQRFVCARMCQACLGYGFGSGSGDLIAGMPHGPMLQAGGEV